MSDYRHTQIGWVILGIGGVVAAVLGLVAWQGGSWFLGVTFLASLLPLLLFSTLTTSVADGKLAIRFGPGPVRFTIPLATIQSCTRVRNSWTDGWGIHSTPSGRVYNISGFDGVALVLSDGSRIRIGTDEPDRLLEAIQKASPATSSSDAALPAATGSERRALATLLAIGLVPAILIVSILYFVGTQPVTVTYSPRSAVVKGAGYSDEIPFDSIESVSLEPELPAMMRRTNGFAAGESLRGNFRIRDSKAHVFVERRHPPFVAVRTTNDYVLVNFKDRSQTEQLYSRLKSVTDAR